MTASIGAGVQIAEPHTLHPGARVHGPVTAGPGLVVFPGAVLGGAAQHRLQGPGAVALGRDCVLREGSTVHRGSVVGCGTTRLGDRVLVMAYSHIGHDAQIGDDVVLANGTQIGGHVTVGARAVFGARSAVHQFVKIGVGAMIAAGALVVGDVPPWTLVAGDRARIVGVNAVGLRGAGIDAAGVRRALRALLDGSAAPAELAEHPAVMDLVAFLKSARGRPLCPRGGR